MVTRQVPISTTNSKENSFFYNHIHIILLTSKGKKRPMILSFNESSIRFRKK